MGRGSIRRGEALLPGLFRCARCGRRLRVQYTGKGGNTQRYVCRGTFSAQAVDNCIGFGGMRIDRVLAQEVLDRLQPLGIEAALAAMQAYNKRQNDKRQQIENAVQQARYEAARARRQYDAVDPDNRLVAGELERRWNDKLVQLRDLEVQLNNLDQTKQAPGLSADERSRLMTLGKDLFKAWNSPGVSVETRKKIIRLLIKEIIIDVVDDSLVLVIHWQGGDHTEMKVKKNKTGHTRWTVAADVIDLVRVLARQLPDNAIAAILNRSGKLTAHGGTWTRTHICGLRNSHGIPVYREGERAKRGEVTLDEVAETLKVSRATAYRMVTSGVLPAQQLCAGAPWIIRRVDLELDAVRRDAEARRSRRPSAAPLPHLIKSVPAASYNSWFVTGGASSFTGGSA